MIVSKITNHPITSMPRLFWLILCSISAISALCLPNQTEAKVATKSIYDIQCSDTDGSNTVNQGTTKLSQLNRQTRRVTIRDTKTDQCASTTKVREYYCYFDKKTQTNQLKYNDISCGGGQYCSKGACIPLPTSPRQETVIPPPIIAPVPSVIPTTVPPAIVPSAPKNIPGIVISGESPQINSTVVQTVLANTSIGRFKITNNGTTAATITSLDITDNGTHWGTSTTLKLYVSDENSTNFTANLAASNNDTTNFSSLNNSGFQINGGAFRYVTVAVDHLGNMLSGDFFNLSIANLGDVRYKVNESDLGFDGNGNGNLNDTITNLPADGRPTLGTLIKQ